MKIFNIMLSRKLGGMEQAFIDYALALKQQDIDVVNITSISAAVNHKLSQNNINSTKLLNINQYDIISRLYFWKLVKTQKPDAIIVHGGRAISFAVFNLGYSVPVISIAHNYKIKNLDKCDYIIALTKHMQDYLITKGISEQKIVIIPNMIAIPSSQELIKDRDFNWQNRPCVIGVMARFVKKKGVDIFIRSLAILRDKGYNCQAIIAGDGEELDNLKQLVVNLNLQKHVRFIGWVDNKDEFFNSIDLFCLPSTHEPFGIIVLESMAYRVPIVSTKTEGPNEIIRHKQDGLLCNITSEDIASSLSSFIDNPELAKSCANSSYLRVNEKYAISNVSKEILKFIKLVFNKKKLNI